jgi:O-antigen ligase
MGRPILFGQPQDPMTVPSEPSSPTKAQAVLAVLSGVFLFANVGSFALVNIALVAGLLLTFLTSSLRQKLMAPWPGFTGKLLLALLGWIFISELASPETWVPGADLAYRAALKPILGLLLGFSLARNHPRKDFLVDWVQRLSWLFLAFIAPALPSIREYRLSLYHSVYGREILGPNVLGGIFGSLFLFTLSELLADTRYRNKERFLRLVLLFVGVGLSGSRSCLILVLVGSASFGLWNFQLGRLLKGGLVGALVLIALGAVNPRFVPGKYTSIGWELGVRGRIWRQALSVIRLVPCLGCGARRYRDKLDEIGPDYVTMDAQGRPVGTDDASLLIPGKDKLVTAATRNPLEAHNDYLTWGAQHGLPGLLLYLLLHFGFLHTAWGAGQESGEQPEPFQAHARALFAVVLGVGAYTFFNAVWFNKELGLLVYFLIGAGLGSLRPQRQA